MSGPITLYTAARCPFAARARIVLAEKAVEVESVEVDLDDRPAFMYELNPPGGRVPVIRHAGLVLPESAVIMEYVEELFPEPALLPPDPAGRARARLAVERFGADLGDPFSDLYFGRPAGSIERVEAAYAALDGRLAASPYLAGSQLTLADIAYVPWLLRSEVRLGVGLGAFPALAGYVDRLCERPSIAAERDAVAALPRRSVRVV